MKQRLVGALVLGCLALIFIPLLLDGDGLSPAQFNTQIPQQPDIDIRQPAEPQRPVFSPSVNSSSDTNPQTATPDIAIPEAVNATTAINESTDSRASDLQPTMSSQGLPEAWSVRLGIFGERINAESLLNRLLRAEYKAYSRPIGTSQRELTAVFVGPVMSKGEAELLLGELDEKFGIKGLVSRFSVDEQ